MWRPRPKHFVSLDAERRKSMPSIKSPGGALSEAYAFDDQGILQNANLLDYRLPTSMDVPRIATHILEEPSADHPYGIRAVGQVPIVPPAAAIDNAIYRATGVRLRELPMTPERLHVALKRAGETAS